MGVHCSAAFFVVMLLVPGMTMAQEPRPRIPNRFVGKWVGEAGRSDSFTLRQTGTAVVITDFGHTIDRFEFDVAADGKVTGSGSATYRFHAMSAANLLLAKRTDIAELSPKVQQVPFSIRGTMSRYGRLHLHAAPSGALSMINAGKRTTMAAWDVFAEVEAEVDASGKHLVAETFGVTVVAGKTTKIAWRARSAATMNQTQVKLPAADAHGRIPKEYVGVWEGSGWEFTKQQTKVRQADVYVDRGAVISKFEINVGPDGKVTGVGKATFWCDMAADAKLILARQAPYAFLEGNIAKIDFEIVGVMTADGKLKLNSKVTRDLPFNNVGNRDTLKAWDVFDGLEATVLAGGPSLLAKADVAQGTDRRVIWKAKKTDYQVVVELVKPGTGTDIYDTWLPEAGPDEKTPGSRAEIRARLEKMGGGEPDQKARKFVFELVDVSREPGICMNWPPKDRATTDPDLQFHPEPIQANYPPDVKLASMIGPEGGWAETPDGTETARSYANLAAHDWGAFGVLRVTAEVIDGPPVVGFLKGHPSRKTILLPKRKDDSFIAEYAKKLCARVYGADVAEKPDDYDGEDDEEYPGKNRFTGDGLTYYQEYRGFYVQRAHRRANPKMKDFYLFNDVPAASNGIRVFERASGLKVWELDREELAANRVINFNHSNQTPHRVDQHGVLIVMGSADSLRYPIDPAGVAATARDNYPKPSGTPKNAKFVAINGESILAPSDHRYQSIVAHELGHTVNLRHHGGNPERDADQTHLVWTFTRQPDGSYLITENGKQIQVLSETGNPSPYMTMYQLFSLEANNKTTGKLPVWLGVDGGENSGDVGCFMRYDSATAYRSKTNPKIRYFIGEAAEPGTGFCIDKKGTGTNGWNHPPQSRFGNATFGPCRFHICVSDAHSP